LTGVETAIADNRAAVAEFAGAARSLDAAAWNTPRRDGAWTPAQIVQHVAIVYEYSRDIVLGTPSGGSLPRFLRPFLRRMVVDSTLKAGRFTRKGRAPAMFKPSADAPAAGEAITRLEAALAGFEAAIRSSHPEARHYVTHPFFGRIGMADYVRFQAIHTRHHRGQLTST
jgi:uncharacterized damage-inducible protein DinB